jgi:hypothetical protein
MCRKIISSVLICTLQAFLGLMTTGCYNSSNKVPPKGENTEVACQESKFPLEEKNIEMTLRSLDKLASYCKKNSDSAKAIASTLRRKLLVIQGEARASTQSQPLENRDKTTLEAEVDGLIEAWEKVRPPLREKMEELQRIRDLPRKELGRLMVDNPGFVKEVHEDVLKLLLVYRGAVANMSSCSRKLKKKITAKEDEKSDLTPKQGNRSPSGSESAQEKKEEAEENPEIALQNQAPDATNNGHTSTTPVSKNLSSNPGRKNQTPNIQIPETFDSEVAPRDPSPTGVTDLRLASQPSSLDGKY